MCCFLGCLLVSVPFFSPLVIFNQYNFQLTASLYHGSLPKCHQPSSASGYKLYHISCLNLELKFLVFVPTCLTGPFNELVVKSRTWYGNICNVLIMGFFPPKLGNLWWNNNSISMRNQQSKLLGDIV